jgi:hypothetical protein
LLNLYVKAPVEALVEILDSASSLSVVEAVLWLGFTRTG